MNKLFKMIFFICIFSYVFSIVEVTNIESSNVILGEKAKFNLTVQNYYYSLFNTFYLGDNDIKDQISLSCNLINDTFLKCEADLNINKLEYLKNLTKILYTIDKVDTNKTVTINKPSILKLNDFKKSYNKYYSFGVSSFYFIVNYNELYNSSISIKFGDISITNCKKNETYNYINCIHEFPENHNNQTLKLIFNGVETDYYITIYAPPEFSKILNLNKGIFYVSSIEQEIYFIVDSSYKINENKIVFVPETPGNSNITLFSCSYYNVGINDAKCSGLLNTIDAYFVYVNDEKTGQLIYVYPEQTMITKVFDINPRNIEISSKAINFIINVDYVVNIDKSVFTLVEEYNSDNKIYLIKCSKIDDLKINCLARIKIIGNYYLYLNGIKQDENLYIKVLSSSLTKAFKIDPNLMEFESEARKNIRIYYDSLNNYTSKNITLIGNNNNTAILTHSRTLTYILYVVTFPAPDTYYVYIDDKKQNAFIKITDKNYTSKVTSISPNLVSRGGHTFIVTVDTNLGINEVYIQLYNVDGINTIYVDLKCEPDSLSETKAICNAYFSYKGDYSLLFNGTKIENLNVSVKDAPVLDKFFPFSFSPSSNKQNIIFYFEDDFSSYFNNITFVGAETLTPTCELNSNFVLNCSAVFNKEDKYYLTLDGVNIGSFINVNEKDNIIEEDDYEEEEINENKSSNGKNEIKDENDSNENNSNNNSNNNSKNNSNNNNNDSNDDSNGRIIKNGKNLLLLLLFLIF